MTDKYIVATIHIGPDTEATIQNFDYHCTCDSLSEAYDEVTDMVRSGNYRGYGIEVFSEDDWNKRFSVN